MEKLHTIRCVFYRGEHCSPVAAYGSYTVNGLQGKVGGRTIAEAGVAAPAQLSVPIRIHGQGVPCRVGAADDLLRDHRFHMGLDVPLQGAGTVDRVIAAVDDGVLGRVGDNQFQLFVLQTLAQVGQHQVNDGADFGLGQALVVDNVVQTVQELGAELALEQLVNGVSGLVGQLVAAVGTALFQILQNQVGAQVRRQDDDGVLEVHRAALAVGNAAIVQHLQQDVEHVRVGLFDLIEQHNAVGVAAHGLGQLAALLIADVSRRRTDQTRDAEFFHILGHVDTDHVLLVVKQGLRQRLGQLGLAEEQEAADGAVRVRDAGAGAQDSVRDLLHGLVLADDPLMQRVRQAEQLLAFAFDELGDRDAGPAGDDVRNFFFRYAVTKQTRFFLCFGQLFFFLQLLLQGGQLAVLQLTGLGVVAGAGRLFNLGLGGFHLGAQALHLVHGVLLVFPLRLLAVEAVAQLGHLLFQRGQTLLGQLVGLFL